MNSSSSSPSMNTSSTTTALSRGSSSNLRSLSSAATVSSRSTMFRRKRSPWRPRSSTTAVAAAAVAVAALSLALASTSVGLLPVAAFHTSLPFMPRHQSCLVSSSSSISPTSCQAIAEAKTVILPSGSSPSSRRARRQRQSVQNRNKLERLYSLPVIDRPEDKEADEDEDDEKSVQEAFEARSTSRRKKSSSSSSSRVKLVKGSKVDEDRLSAATTASRRMRSSKKMTPLRMKMRSLKQEQEGRTETSSRSRSPNSDAASTTLNATGGGPSGPSVQFKGLSTTSYHGNRKASLIAPPKPTFTAATTTSTSTTSKSTTARTRSSTMPGFLNAESDRQRAFRDGIRVAEQQSGRKFVDTPEAKRTRRKVNGENMYKNSASVPESLVQFAQEIHDQERITREQEIALGTKTQEAIRLQRHYEALREELMREPTDDEWCAAAGKINMEAIRQTIEEGLDAKNKLVTSNLRMVQSVVNTYIRNGLSAQYNAGDLMQEGILALIRAAEKFEPDRGWKFSTYAMYWVRASVKRNQIYQSRVITVPQRLYESHKRLLKVRKELEQSLERKPTKEELGQAVGMSVQQVERCFKAMEQRCYSLDQEINNSKKPMSASKNNNNLLIDIMQENSDKSGNGNSNTISSTSPADNDYEQQRMAFLRQDMIETLHRQLTPDEVELLLFRYGLKDFPGAKKLGAQPTIAELSEAVGLKPDKVRRVINRALHQLRSAQSGEWLAFERELR